MKSYIDIYQEVAEVSPLVEGYTPSLIPFVLMAANMEIMPDHADHGMNIAEGVNPMLAKHLVIRITEPRDEQLRILEGFADMEGAANQAITAGAYQIERCPTTGTLHLQGYIFTQKQMRLRALKGLLRIPDDGQSHYIRQKYSKSTVDQAWNYATKEATRHAVGRIWGRHLIPAEQGKRNDLRPCLDMVLAGRSIREVAMQYPEAVAKHADGILKWQEIVRVIPTRVEKKIIVLVGETGCGKTEWAMAQEPNMEICDWANGFMMGYHGGEAVLFNDYYGNVPWGKFLNMLEPTTHSVNVKNMPHGMSWTPKRIYISSNAQPQEWYTTPKKNLPEGAVVGALIRRLTSIALFHGEWPTATVEMIKGPTIVEGPALAPI